MSQKTEQKGESSSDKRDKYLGRRRFLAATGTVAGTGVLTGCLHGGQESGDDGEEDGTEDGEGDGVEDGMDDGGEEEMSRAPGTREHLEQKYPGVEILSPDPENVQAASRSTYDDQYITPAEELYIRNHYLSPDIDESNWSVEVTGMDEDAEVSVESLKNDYSEETVTFALQCSGNGRSFFEPQVGGNQWHYGAAGNTEWTGAPAGEVLEDMGVDTSDGYLAVMGGDHPEGEDVFSRSIPMEKVAEDCIFAYQMNGDDIPIEHGHPVRFVVPGWYGCNNIKWVQEVRPMDTMLIGPEWEDRPAAYTDPDMDYDGEGQRTYTHWQQYSYRIVPQQDDLAIHYEDIPTYDIEEQMERTDEIRNAYCYDQAVKSIIGRPGEGATIESGTQMVRGVAWAGDQSVDTVEVSPDGGDTWLEAEIYEGEENQPHGWVLFRYEWEAESGDYTLVSRATDEEGRTQPAEISSPDEGLRGIEDDKFPWNKSGYANNAYMPHSVDVTVQ